MLLFSCWLASCATVPKEQSTTNNQNLSWNSRVQTLSQIESWDLKALIAIRSQKDAGSASLQWQQQNQNYHIQLFGPLGTGSYELTGQPGKVELAGSSGKRFYATSPEALLAQQTGWHLPISYLKYWIRGLPVPTIPAEKSFDSYNHLTKLKQEGWDIEFLRYTSINGIDVPNKIFFHNAQLNIKIIINQWHF